MAQEEPSQSADALVKANGEAEADNSRETEAPVDGNLRSPSTNDVPTKNGATAQDQPTAETDYAASLDSTVANKEDKPELNQGEEGKPVNGHHKSSKATRDAVDEKIDRYRRDQRKPFDRRSNIRSNFENLPETDDPEEIRRQVEFYFSDANLPMDAYLLSATGGPENKPFPLKQLHTFKRMRRFQPYSAVLEAVKQSKVLDVDEAGEITRKEPLSSDYDSIDTQKNKEIYEEKSLQRTVYVKGFGYETETTQTDVEEFFAAYGEISAVRLRRWNDGIFKGSALIEFADAETAKQFLELEPKPKWRGNRSLEIRTKKDWQEQKAKFEKENPGLNHGNRLGMKRKHDDDRGGRYKDDRRGGNRDRGRDNPRGNRRGDGNGDRHRERGDNEDWRERRSRYQGKDRERKGQNGRKSDHNGDKDDGKTPAAKDDKPDDVANQKVDSDNEMEKLSKRKRSSDDVGDAEAGTALETKKVKVDDSNTDKGDDIIHEVKDKIMTEKGSINKENDNVSTEKAGATETEQVVG